MKKYTIGLLLLFFVIKLNAQVNYYIATSGNNSNNGALATPWKTLQYAIDHINSGDTINVFGGTYNEKINLTKSGVYIRNYNNIEAIISGAGITSQVSLIQISDRSNITISGLTVANNIQLDAQGILVDGNSQNITIQYCTIHDIHFSSNPNASVNSSKNAQGIIVYGTNASTAISNLKIHANKLFNCRLGYSEGIAVNGNVDRFEITNNEVHDLTNIGIDAIGHEGTCPNAANDQARNGVIKDNIVYKCLSAYATSGGIYVDGGKNIAIENNVSYHNGYGIEIGCENIGKTTDGIYVRSNILYDNEVCGIALGGYDYPSGSGKVINSVCTNNTLFKNDFKNDGTGELYLTYSENAVIENNIFYLSNQNVLAYAELGQPSLKFNYNLFYSDTDPLQLEADWNGIAYTSFTAFKSGTATNANSKTGNPQFVIASISNPDFHIASTSVAKDAGNPAFVATNGEVDMDSQARKNGVVDCGADEYYAAVSVYTFNGNGNWDVPANWVNGLIPPSVLSGNQEIIIDPVTQGECILNVSQQVTSGAKFTIQPDKKFRIIGNLSVNN